jgi:UPF0755 protein
VKKALAVLVVLLIAAGVVAGLTYRRLGEPFRGYQASEQFVDIPAGSGSRAIGDRLVASGVVRNEVIYRLALWASGEGRRLKAGEYRFDRAMTPFEVIDKIARGDVFVINVTFPEGLNIAEMAQIFEAHGFGPAATFVDAARNLALLKGQGGQGGQERTTRSPAENLEGYLFPDTYALSRHTDAAKLVGLMVARFQEIAGSDLKNAAAARNLTLHQVVTLGSIVEKETARPEERPIVAAVYENRLKIGMPLQCDPTVIYALERLHRYNGNLRHDDLAVDSPYNTYRYGGLPPGPIASPGRESLQAVVHPADVDFLYFVSKNDGSHQFARTLEEHNRNVQKFQIEYFRARRAQRGQEGH